MSKGPPCVCSVKPGHPLVFPTHFLTRKGRIGGHVRTGRVQAHSGGGVGKRAGGVRCRWACMAEEKMGWL